ncbi:MAG: orotidine-5'-phosphate decarboxylase [Deltaproteobacteria bacterium]|nr:orotidine-5'-phosphate decarboxylase [Deltaproteobacteria bacterium]
MACPGSDRLIFPLDVDSLELALPWVERLRGSVGIFKVGLELFSAAGPEAVRAVREASGAGVFLDVKLHDIPATVEGAARVLRGVGPAMLTVHTSGGKAMLEAAVRGAGPDVRVLGVTRLTSLEASVDEVCELAILAREAGCGGIVCSGAEAAAVRKAVGPRLAIVCPGVRPAGSDAGDQARVVTPTAAIASGADYVVCGRPIRGAEDPAAVANRIADEIARALASR